MERGESSRPNGFLRRQDNNMLNLRKAMAPTAALAAAAMVAVGLAGCGGSSSSTPDSRAVTFAVDWAERSRAISGPASAESFRFVLVNAQTDGKNVVFVGNRDATKPQAHTENYTTTDRSMAGQFQMNIEFFGEPNANGPVVGTASAQVTINAEGGGIPNISTTSTIKTLTVDPNQEVRAGSRHQLAFSAVGDEGVIPVAPGVPVWEVIHGMATHGHEAIQFVDGLAHGVHPGSSMVRAAIIVGGGQPPIMSEAVEVVVTMSDFRTVLSPGQVADETADQEAAHGVLYLSKMSGNRLGYSLHTEELDASTVTHATINFSSLGLKGPEVFHLFEGSGNFAGHAIGVLGEADIQPSVGGPGNMAQVLQALDNNELYAQVETTINPNGAIRGQLGTKVTMVADISGAQEVPPVITDANVVAFVEFNATMTDFTVRWEDAQDYPGDMTAGHIHVGVPGSNGPVIFFLFTNELPGGPLPDPFAILLDASYLIPRPNVPDYDAAVAAILSGETYINFHSVTVPTGLTRGQIVSALG